MGEEEAEGERENQIPGGHCRMAFLEEPPCTDPVLDDPHGACCSLCATGQQVRSIDMFSWPVSYRMTVFYAVHPPPES